MMESLTINFEEANADNFSEIRYLKANPDVFNAVKNGVYSSGFEHFCKFGHTEKRKLWPELNEALLAQRITHIINIGKNLEIYDKRFLIEKKNRLLLPFSIGPISNNNYDQEVLDLFSAPEKMFIDVGAGWRNQIIKNVVNLDIYDFPSTDVLAFAEDLPFKDDTFDGAVCLAVLEYLKDPFRAAAELVRVVKPSGVIIVDWPFLQPMHGYPSHFFNATSEGAREVFSRISGKIEIDVEVPIHMHPMATYRWFLQEWSEGLETLLGKLIFLITPPFIYLRKPWQNFLGMRSTTISDKKIKTIASGFRIYVKNSK